MLFHFVLHPFQVGQQLNTFILGSLVPFSFSFPFLLLSLALLKLSLPLFVLSLLLLELVCLWTNSFLVEAERVTSKWR
jgi:hypothetical protein